MKDFQSGWSGLKDYAVSCGVATVDDGDDAVAAKIRAVIQGTLPEAEVTERVEPVVGPVLSATGGEPPPIG